MVFRIGGKPALFHPFMLLEQFVNAPETGKADDAENSGQNDIGDHCRDRKQDQARDEKNGPDTIGEKILAFDHNGMKETNAQKRGKAEDNTMKMHEQSPPQKTFCKAYYSIS